MPKPNRAIFRIVPIPEGWEVERSGRRGKWYSKRVEFLRRDYDKRDVIQWAIRRAKED